MYAANPRTIYHPPTGRLRPLLVTDSRYRRYTFVLQLFQDCYCCSYQVYGSVLVPRVTLLEMLQSVLRPWHLCCDNTSNSSLEGYRYRNRVREPMKMTSKINILCL